MNTTRAKQMESELAENPVAGWRASTLLGHGKSAAVFRAERDGIQGALKIFDPDLVAAFGRDTQLKRVQRELGLQGKQHRHLIPVLDGGECPSTGHIFVVTTLLDGWRDMAACLQAIPPTAVASIIEQVASAAEFLDGLGIVHRDIKPANIVINTDYTESVLLDLGVIRPLDASQITDDESFIGTLQYSSPEFLYGEEERTPDGGRALSFYQLGAVLHDLLTRKPLFEGEQPYARMVEAVKSKTPRIDYPEDTDLAQLARNCLLKQPQQRLRLVSWDDFRRSSRASASESARRRSRVRARLHGATPTKPSGEQHIDLRDVMEACRAALRQACVRNSDFSGCTVSSTPGDAAPHSLTLRLETATLLPPLVVRIHYTNPDDGGEAVRVTTQAAMVSGNAVFPASEPCTVFEGAADIASIVAALETDVYARLEQALDLRDAGQLDEPVTPLQGGTPRSEEGTR